MKTSQTSAINFYTVKQPVSGQCSHFVLLQAPENCYCLPIICLENYSVMFGKPDSLHNVHIRLPRSTVCISDTCHVTFKEPNYFRGIGIGEKLQLMTSSLQKKC